MGCAVADLTHQTIECQSDKIGKVIGKQGATIKLLEEQCHVVMDVDSVAAKIKLTGSSDAIAVAITEIQNIILSVDVDVAMEKHVLGYFTAKVCWSVALYLYHLTFPLDSLVAFHVYVDQFSFPTTFPLACHCSRRYSKCTSRCDHRTNAREETYSATGTTT